MKNKLKKYGQIILITILIIGNVFYYWLQTNEKKASYNPSNNIIIENNTFYPINKTMEVIVRDILFYNELTIIINVLPDGVDDINDNLRLRALIIPNPNYKHTYLILLATDIIPEDINGILLHEAAHIQQYESGDLKILNRELSIYQYKKDTISSNLVPYFDRAFEKDANCFEELNKSILDSLLRR